MFSFDSFFSIFKLFYCCSIMVVCIFSPPLYPTPAQPTSLPCFHPPPWFCPCVLYSSSCKPLSHCPLPTPLWLLLDCSWFQCLWLYFVCFFLLLIMFQLKVRSYGICPSLPGLFHLAQCSPSMLSWRVGAPSFSLLRRIPLCKCTIVFGSIHLLMGTYVASSTWLL